MFTESKSFLKRVTAMLLIAMMFLSVIPTANIGITAKAADSEIFIYEVSDDEVTITGLKDEYTGDLVIPNTLGGYPVTVIGDSAFSHCTGLTSVIISNGVTSIGNSAFYYCSGLTGVTIPDTVTEIGTWAFQGCKSLTNISISENVTLIDTYAFLYCDSLVSIDVATENENYSSQDGVLFNKDKTTLIKYPEGKAKAEYIIPDSVTSLEFGSFENCQKLTSVTLPCNLKVENNYFQDSSLASINVNKDNPYHTSVDGVLYSKDETKLIIYPMGRDATEFVIPDKVTNIGVRVFMGDGKLEKIVLGEGVTCLEYCSLSRCISLKEVVISDSVTELPYGTFEVCENLTTVTIPNSITEIGDCTFRDCYALKKIEIPSSVSYIGDDAFDFSDLEEITILNPNCEIYDSASTLNNPEVIRGLPGSTAEEYAKKYEITFVNYCTHDEDSYTVAEEIPATCTTDGYTAGIYCNDCEMWISGHKPLYAQHTDENEDKICDVCGSEVFEIIASGTYDFRITWELDEGGRLVISGNGKINNCFSDILSDYIKSIKTVDIRQGVTGIGNYAFSGCKYLTTINIPDSVASMGEYVFEDCSSLKSITIPDKVRIIGEAAFRDCINLTSVTIHDSVKAIGAWAFSGCTKLTDITLPDGLADIGDTAFLDCQSLESITIPEGITVIRESLFNNCYKLSSVTLPDSITTIESFSFSDCDSLSEITLPKNLTTIDQYAFSGCDSLTDIVIPDSVTTIALSAFESCSNLESVTLGKGVSSIEDFAFFGCSPEFVMYGYSGTYAEEYANANEITFIPLCSHDETSHISSAEIPATCVADGYTAGVYCNECERWISGHNVIKAHHTDENNDEVCDNCDTVLALTIKVDETKTIEVGEGETVYIAFTPNVTGVYSFTADSDDDTFGYLFNADRKEITSNDDNDEADTDDFKITYRLEKGTKYYFGARYYLSDASGSFKVILVCDEADCPHSDVTDFDAALPTCTTNGYAEGKYCNDCERWISGHEIVEARHTDSDNDGICDICDKDLTIIASGNYGENITWTFRNNGVLTLSGTGDMNADEAPWFEYNEIIKEVIIENGITSIGDWAFECCGKLTKVTIPNSVTTIGYSAFEDCNSLASIAIPDSVTEIAASAFMNCAALTAVTLPKGIESIGEYAFGYTVGEEDYLKIEKFVVSGYSETVAETYAGENEFEFVSIGTVHRHAYDVKITKTPTCTISGIETHTCSCGDSFTITIAALGHNYSVDWTIDKAAACTTKGSKSHHCTRCDAKTDVTEIKATGHTYGDWATTKEATCTEKGTMKRACTVCGKTVSKTLSALGHKYSTDWTVDKAETCTTAGSKSHHCTRCDAKTDVTEIAKTGHSYTSYKTTVKATCTETGKKTRTCQNCGKTTSKTISALGHNYSSKWTVDKAATCTKAGSKSHHCTRCDAKTDVTEIAKTGHNYTSKVTKKATCSETGVRTYTCSNCGRTYTKSISKLSHTYKTTTTTKATTSKNGTKTTKCTVCGKVKSTTTIAKISTVKLSYTSYTYSGSIKKPTVTVTDSNGNKLVKDTDYTVKYASGRKNVGKYTVTVTFKGNYSGTKTLTFTIKPKGATISKLTAGTKKFTVKLNELPTQITGYQIQYSTSSKMTSATTKTYTTATKTSRTISNLKSAKTYYVRVRTYKTVDGAKIYSSWSSVKNVKTK